MGQHPFPHLFSYASSLQPILTFSRIIHKCILTSIHPHFFSYNPQVHPQVHPHISLHLSMDTEHYKRCGDCMPCARQNYVDNYVTEDKDRERILSSGPRECENPKDLTKRAKISSSPCKCGCARLLRPPKPVMRIDYAKQAAVKLAQQRKQVLEYTVERVRAEILQNDNEGAAYFWNVHSGTTLQSHIQRVRLYYNEHYNSLCVTCIHTSIHTSGFRIAN